MDEIVITEIMISEFKNHLRLEEKSSNTIEKYTRDVEAFTAHINSAAVTKEVVIAEASSTVAPVTLHPLKVNPVPRVAVKLTVFPDSTSAPDEIELPSTKPVAGRNIQLPFFLLVIFVP